MNKRLILLVCVFILFLGAWIYSSSNSKTTAIKLDAVSTSKEILEDVNETKEYAESTAKWMNHNEQLSEEELGFFEPHHEESHEDEHDPKIEVIKYFIAGLQSNDSDIFMSSFYPESISKDLFRVENPNKDVVIKDIMNAISRDNSLKDVSYSENDGLMNKDPNEVSLTMTYNDGYNKGITLQVQALRDAHSDHTQDIYVITTSAWNIIKQLEENN